MPVRNMILAGLFAALIAISSQVSITLPPNPVPHTLQVPVVLLAAVVLGSRWGFTSVGVWVLLGVFGLPVFTQGKAGAAVLFGPTGGFLFGYMLCALVVGRLAERAELGFGKAFAFMLLGMVFIYGLGLAGFMASFAYFLHKPMTWGQAAMYTVAPFLPFDVVKALVAAFVGVKLRRALARAGYVNGR
jgi:biotin transport system substrate-specific component